MRVSSLLSLLLALACAQPPEPLVRQQGVTDGKEPVVRVHLRSLGDWSRLRIRGKGGLRVTTGQLDYAVEEAYTLSRAGGAVRLRPLEGVVTVGDHSFSGELTWRDGHLVNHVTMENYVLGVLRGELPLKRVPREAAAAQAIAVRSYTLHYLAKGRERFDVDDTTLYQRYVGLRYAPDDDHLRAGVRETSGLYLSSGGAPLKAYYHSTCGGHTTDVPTGLDRAPIPAMRGVACEYCKNTKYWRWETELPDAVIVKAASLTGALERVAVVERGPGERAREVEVVAGGHAKRMHANELRMRVGPSKLRSTNLLALEHVGTTYHVRGSGWGHGVGLCQMGAIGMAQKGSSGTEIVRHYYPGATVRRAY